MTPHYSDPSVTLFHGDCLDVLRTLAEASVDAVVTDPPYGLKFMGKEWDGADGFRRSLNANDVGRDNAFGRTSRTSPEYRAGHLFQEWCQAWASECLRVLKPGGHLLAFGGTRTAHRLACGIEDAGFEMRDTIAWLYGSGFPKALDVSKAIDKLDASAERLARARTFQAWLRQHLPAQQVNAATGTDMGHHLTTHPTQPSVATADLFDKLRPLLPAVPDGIEALVAQRTVESANFKARAVVGTVQQPDASRVRLGFVGENYNGDAAGAVRDVDITAPATPDAATWHGWATALKPAHEPIIVARKPLIGSVAANVLAHGTGALNIDATRVAHGAEVNTSLQQRQSADTSGMRGLGGSGFKADHTQPLYAAGGRWPANVVLSHTEWCVEVGTRQVRTGTAVNRNRTADNDRATYAAYSMGNDRGEDVSYGTDGVETVAAWNCPEGCPVRELDAQSGGDTGGASRYFPTFKYEAKAPTFERPGYMDDDGVSQAHSTVKPLDLMRWLVRLVTPPGGTVLDPFAGSGTTGEACVIEGFKCVLVERETSYLPLIVARLSKPIQPDLFGGVA